MKATKLNNLKEEYERTLKNKNDCARSLDDKRNVRIVKKNP